MLKYFKIVKLNSAFGLRTVGCMKYAEIVLYIMKQALRSSASTNLWYEHNSFQTPLTDLTPVSCRKPIRSGWHLSRSVSGIRKYIYLYLLVWPGFETTVFLIVPRTASKSATAAVIRFKCMYLKVRETTGPVDLARSVWDII